MGNGQARYARPLQAAKLSVPRIQEAAAAEEAAHEQENKNADLIDGPAGGCGQGGDFGAQRDTALMGGVHGQQNRNARVEQNLLLQARQAKLPIVGEHSVSAIAENTLKKLCRVGKTAGAENHERTRQNAECARHAQRMAELTRAAGRQVVFRRLAQAVQAAPDEVGQPRAVPQAAGEEGYNQVSVLARLAAPAAAQRNIDIIPQPLRQADVPPRRSGGARRRSPRSSD